MAEYEELQRNLNELLSDPLLSDVGDKVTENQVDRLIALEEGEAFLVKVLREDGEHYDVIVGNYSTVKELKQSLQQTVESQLEGKKISWRHVWQNNVLEANGRRLDKEDSLISEYGIGPNTLLSFARYYKRKKER